MIRVASYNIHKGVGLDRRRDPRRILDILDEIDADIVALQEADRRFGSKAAVISPHLLEEGMRWRALPFGRAASMGWHGNALLVRKDTVVEGCTRITLPALEPRGAVMADLAVRGGPLRIVGMHLDLSGLWRRRQAHTILTHVGHDASADPAAGPRATILMGDLNEWSAGGCLRDFGRDHLCAPTGASFHAARPIARLDRIMVSHSIRIVECGVHRSATARKASDHLPIWATVEIGTEPADGS